MSERLVVGALLLSLLLAALSGCARAAEPQVAVRILSITQRGLTPPESSGPQVSFNVSVNLTNTGTVDYLMSGEDFLFETDTGIEAFVSGWQRLSGDVSRDHRRLEPGEGSDFLLHAVQLGRSHGNLTTVQFRDGPVQPVAV